MADPTDDLARLARVDDRLRVVRAAQAASPLGRHLRAQTAIIREDTEAVRATVRLGRLLRAAADGDAGAIHDEAALLDGDEVAALKLAAETLTEVLGVVLGERGRRG